MRERSACRSRRSAKPEDLFDDPHLKASGGLTDITLMNGTKTQVPILPIEMDGRRFGTRLDLPKSASTRARCWRTSVISAANRQARRGRRCPCGMTSF